VKERRNKKRQEPKKRKRKKKDRWGQRTKADKGTKIEKKNEKPKFHDGNLYGQKK